MPLSSPVDDGEFWQVGTREGKGIPRNIKIGGHRVAVRYTVTEEVM